MFSRGDKVRATFVGANPRNDLRLEQTYAAVERRHPENGKWERFRDDSDWGLIFHWKRTSGLRGTSEVEIVWNVEEETPAGEYRLRYFGDSKAIGGKLTAFDGASKDFRIA